MIFGRVPVLRDENCHGLGKREREKGKESRENKERGERGYCFIDGEMSQPRLGWVMCRMNDTFKALDRTHNRRDIRERKRSRSRARCIWRLLDDPEAESFEGGQTEQNEHSGRAPAELTSRRREQALSLSERQPEQQPQPATAQRNRRPEPAKKTNSTASLCPPLPCECEC